MTRQPLHELIVELKIIGHHIEHVTRVFHEEPTNENLEMVRHSLEIATGLFTRIFRLWPHPKDVA